MSNHSLSGSLASVIFSPRTFTLSVETSDLERDEAVPPLQLDDVQSAVPLDEDVYDAEVNPTVAFPSNTVQGSPRVTITTSSPQEDSHMGTANATFRYPQYIVTPGSVPFPRHDTSQPSTSRVSTVGSELDKLGDLPTAFSSARYPFTRSMPSHTKKDSTSSTSSVVRPQSGGSEPSLESNPVRPGMIPKTISFDGERRSFSSPTSTARKVGFLSTSTSLPVGVIGPFPVSPMLQPASPGLRPQPSHSPARSVSPFRIFLRQRVYPRAEPFSPVDPYQLSIIHPSRRVVLHFLSQVFLQLYRHLLLRLPSIYFARVTHVFIDAEVSRPEVQRMIDERNQREGYWWPADHEWVSPNVSSTMIRFKESWESFIESVLKEWKTLNVVSALLLTAILAIFQIEGASKAIAIRTSASLSLICALMSLIYGCVYILRFATMKSMYRAFKWAEEAQQTSSVLWSVWVLLALPAVWLSWSMLFFCFSILDFVWEQPAVTPDSLPNGIIVSSKRSDRGKLVSRIIISFVFGIGVIYFILVVRTFRSWKDPTVPERTRESLDATGRWSTRTPSPGREISNAAAKPSQEQRFDRQSV